MAPTITSDFKCAFEESPLIRDLEELKGPIILVRRGVVIDEWCNEPHPRDIFQVWHKDAEGKILEQWGFVDGQPYLGTDDVWTPKPVQPTILDYQNWRPSTVMSIQHPDAKVLSDLFHQPNINLMLFAEEHFPEDPEQCTNPILLKHEPQIEMTKEFDPFSL